MGFTIAIGPLRSGRAELTKEDEDDQDGPVVLDEPDWRNVMSMSYSCADAFAKQSPQHTNNWNLWRKGETGGDPTTVFLTPEMVKQIFQLPTSGTCHTKMLQSVMSLALKLFSKRKLYMHIS
jgi:hypothetical protein